MRYSTTRPLAPTEAHGCEQLAQSCYSTMRRPGVEPATSRLQVQHSTATLPSPAPPYHPLYEQLSLILEVMHAADYFYDDIDDDNNKNNNGPNNNNK